MDREDKIKLCRIVGILLLSDGKLMDEEVEHMNSLFDRMELSEEERLDCLERIEANTEVLQDAAALRAHGHELLDELQDASKVDGIIAGPEVDLIQMIASVVEGN